MTVNAIEVLKKSQNDLDNNNYYFWSEHETLKLHKALGEAITALEQNINLKALVEGLKLEDIPVKYYNGTTGNAIPKEVFDRKVKHYLGEL